MRTKKITRPDQAAMLRVLEQESGSAAEVVLRLAWQQGLTREELRALRWSQIDLTRGEVRLPDRAVPLVDDVAACLAKRAELPHRPDGFVVSGRGGLPMEPQSISRLARTALNREEALGEVSLKDLRHDFVVRQLGEKPWPQVARISGMAATTMYTTFAPWLRGETSEKSGDVPPVQPTGADFLFLPKSLPETSRAFTILNEDAPGNCSAGGGANPVSAPVLDDVFRSNPRTAPILDDFFVARLVQAELDDAAPAGDGGDVPSSLGLLFHLAWHHCLEVQTLLALTWAEVDLSAGLLRLSGREGPRQIALDGQSLTWLTRLSARRAPGDDPHVLLTPRSRRPYDAPRISKAARTALIRAGAEHLTLQEFTQAARRSAQDKRLLAHMAAHGPVHRGDVTALLETTPAGAYAQLRRLTGEGRLVRIGGRYYLPGTVVPPEEQYAAVRRYLEEYGVAYLQALADTLGMERRACARLLKRWVGEDRLARQGQLYCLPAGLPLPAEEEAIAAFAPSKPDTL